MYEHIIVLWILTGADKRDPTKKQKKDKTPEAHKKTVFAKIIWQPEDWRLFLRLQ
jgi:hypothetical protein